VKLNAKSAWQRLSCSSKTFELVHLVAVTSICMRLVCWLLRPL